MNKFFILCLVAVALVSAAKKPKTYADCDKLVKTCKNCGEGTVDSKKCKADLASKDLKKAADCAIKVACVNAVEKHIAAKEKKEWQALEKKYTALCPTNRAQCRDLSPACPQWALRNPSECTRNPDFMLANCAMSCCPACTGRNTLRITAGICPKRSDLCTVNAHSSCHAWAKKKECTKNKKWMRTYCMQSCCKKCQKDEFKCPTVKESCEDKHKKPNKKKGNAACVAWAMNGECQTNPKWMASNCAKECCPICRAVQPIPFNQPVAVAPQRVFGGYGSVGIPYMG